MILKLLKIKIFYVKRKTTSTVCYPLEFDTEKAKVRHFSIFQAFLVIQKSQQDDQVNEKEA